MLEPTVHEQFSEAARVRIQALDVIRGIAIFGILAVNIGAFAGPELAPVQVDQPWHARLLRIAVMALFEGKMITLLSILFGAGLAVQFARAEYTGLFNGFYRRRMLCLFAIGLAHGLLLFHYDILTSYAVVGLLLLFFVRRDQRSLLRIANGCLVWSYLFIVLVAALVVIFGSEEPQSADGEARQSWNAVEHFFTPEAEVETFRDGTLRQMMARRAVYIAIIGGLFWVVTGWYQLGCALLGIWLIRAGLFALAPPSGPLLRRFIWVGLPVGLALSLAGVMAYLNDPNGMLSFGLVISGALPLGLAYLSLLLRWVNRPDHTWLKRMFASVGRVALSNYLFQSLLCGLVFYKYGLALYGALSPTTVFGIVLLIWAIQIFVTRLWLRNFKQGVVEWLWRRIAGKNESLHVPQNVW